MFFKRFYIFLLFIFGAFAQQHDFPVKLFLQKTIVGDTLVVNVYAVDTVSATPQYNFGNVNFVFTIDTACVYTARQLSLSALRYPMDSAFFTSLLAANQYINFYASGIVDTQVNVTLTRHFSGTDSLSIAANSGNIPPVPDTVLLFSVFLKMKSCACADSAFKWKSPSVGVIQCGNLHYVGNEIGFDYLPSESDSIRIVSPNPKDITLDVCQAIDVNYLSNRPGFWTYLPEIAGGNSSIIYPVASSDDSATVNVHPDVLNFPGNTRTDTLILEDGAIPGCRDTALIVVNLSSVDIIKPTTDTTICRLDTLVFIADSNDINNIWSYTNNGTSGTIAFVPYDSLVVPFVEPSPRTFKDTIALQLGYCYDTVIVTSGKPDPNFQPLASIFCPNDQNIEFIADSSNYPSYLWTISPANFAFHHNINTAPRDTIDIGNEPGTFDVKLIVEDNLGCKDSLTQTYTVDNNAYTLSLRLFLEGPYDKSTFFTMFPSPFGLLDSVYSNRAYLNAKPEGADSVKMSFSPTLGVPFVPPAGAVDVIEIQLRADPNDPNSVVDSAYAWLMSDGTIRDFETGTKDSVTFCNPIVGNGVWIVIRHRNHLPIISSQPVNLDNTGTNVLHYDFWIPGKTRNDAVETKSHSGIRMMIGGNVADNIVNNEVNAEDLMRITPENGTVSNQYHRSDIDMDGNVNAIDYTIISNNNDELYRSTVDD